MTNTPIPENEDYVPPVEGQVLEPEYGDDHAAPAYESPDDFPDGNDDVPDDDSLDVDDPDEDGV